MKLAIYTAHPITGMSYKDVMSYYTSLRIALEKGGFYVLCPMVRKDNLAGETNLKSSGYSDPVVNDHSIIERDRWMVGKADIVLVDLTGATRVSIGCMMELAWACELRKLTIVVMEDGNVHQHAFVKQAADHIFTELSAALDYLERLAE